MFQVFFDKNYREDNNEIQNTFSMENVNSATALLATQTVKDSRDVSIIYYIIFVLNIALFLSAVYSSG